MKTGRTIAILLLATVMVIAGLAVFHSGLGPEPVYQGRTVDAWLEDMTPP
jgi:hypothetical protein